MKQDTNNPQDKSSVDDLFARRLGQHSIAPDKAGWERLQSKMAGKPEARVLTFWQNPTLHRYAVAACVSALLLAGGWGWLLLRSADGVMTRQNQVATTKTGQKTEQIGIKEGRQRSSNDRIADQQIVERLVESQRVSARKSKAISTPELAEKMIAQTKRSASQPVRAIKPVERHPDSQLAETGAIPIAINPITAPTKPVAEQVLIVTIAEPDALIEARQAANWSESAEKTLIVDVSPKPTKGRRILQQVVRVRNGAGLELAGNDDQSLLSRAFQTIKNKTNNKPLKQ